VLWHEISAPGLLIKGNHMDTY